MIPFDALIHLYSIQTLPTVKSQSTLTVLFFFEFSNGFVFERVVNPNRGIVAQTLTLILALFFDFAVLLLFSPQVVG